MRGKLWGLEGIFIPYFERSEIVAGLPAEPICRKISSNFFKYTVKQNRIKDQRLYFNNNGGFNAVRLDILIRFQVWNQRVFMGAKYKPSRRTYMAMRIFGAVLK